MGRASVILGKVGYLLRNPRTLLLCDAVGAAATACATWFLLAGGLLQTGIPVGFLYSMAVVAGVFVLFDVMAYRGYPDAVFALRAIACLNIGYCVFVMTTLLLFRGAVSPLGLGYFFIEIVIVVPLAIWELTVASRAASLRRAAAESEAKKDEPPCT